MYISGEGSLGPISGFMRDGASLFEGHAACVKAKAFRSVELVGKVSKEEAEQVVSQVFARCCRNHTPGLAHRWHTSQCQNSARSKKEDKKGAGSTEKDHSFKFGKVGCEGECQTGGRRSTLK